MFCNDKVDDQEPQTAFNVNCLHSTQPFTGFFLIYLVEELVGTFLLVKRKTDQDCCKEKADCHYDLEITSLPVPSSQSPGGAAPNLLAPADSYRKTAAFRDFFTSKFI